jgi:hypothetical protein
MYISLADSRANGFVKWANAHQPEKLGDARDGAGEGGVIAARVLAQGATTPAGQPHRRSKAKKSGKQGFPFETRF